MTTWLLVGGEIESLTVDEVSGYFEAVWIPQPNSEYCKYKLKINSELVADELLGTTYQFLVDSFDACSSNDIEVISVSSSGKEGRAISTDFERGKFGFQNTSLYCREIFKYSHKTYLCNR